MAKPSPAGEAGGDRLTLEKAVALPFQAAKSLFKDRHKITETHGQWPGLGMGVTVGHPLE